MQTEEDITAYGGTGGVGAQFSDTIDLLMDGLRRWPVRNREPRELISSLKRALVHARDGGICRFCGVAALLTVDHIIPRSAFPPGDLEIADRSDNLVSACRSCNAAKSNFEYSMRKRQGVVVRCWNCRYPDWEDELPPLDVLVFCGRCGSGAAVPDVYGWVL